MVWAGGGRGERQGGGLRWGTGPGRGGGRLRRHTGGSWRGCGDGGEVTGVAREQTEPVSAPLRQDSEELVVGLE